MCGNIVEMISIDSLNEKVTTIKLDIEGAEIKTLKGAINTIISQS